jgi:hypothetical protein
VVRQEINLLGHPLWGEPFQGLDNAGVQRPPPLLEQTPIGHFVRQGVLEGVGQVREQAGLIEKLGGL